MRERTSRTREINRVIRLNRYKSASPGLHLLINNHLLDGPQGKLILLLNIYDQSMERWANHQKQTNLTYSDKSQKPVYEWLHIHPQFLLPKCQVSLNLIPSSFLSLDSLLLYWYSLGYKEPVYSEWNGTYVFQVKIIVVVPHELAEEQISWCANIHF